MTFEEVETLQEQVKNNKYEKEKLLDVLEDYKWLLEFKPFEELVNTNPISIEALFDACKAYARWYGYTQCEMGLQKILFFDGWRKSVEECELFRYPTLNGEKYGLKLDENAWTKAMEDRYRKDLEEFNKR